MLCNASPPSPAWQTDTIRHPSECVLHGGLLECTVTEGQEISLVLPIAAQGSASSATYQLVNQPTYSTFSNATREFRWRPYYSSTNGRSHPDGFAGDHRMYFYSSFSGLSNFTIAFRVHDRPRPVRKLPPPFRNAAQPDFPLIAWGLEPTRFAAARAQGFTYVTSQNLGHAFEMASRATAFNRQSAITAFTNSAMTYLHTAHHHGLKVILQMHVPEVVAAVKDHPALYAIQLPQDEADFALDPQNVRYVDPYYSVAVMRQMREAIRVVAPDMPVAAVFSARFSGAISYVSERPGDIEGFRQYLNSVDIVFFDYYLQSARGDYSQIADPRPFAGMLEEALDLVNDTRIVIPLIEVSHVYGTIDANLEEFPISPAHVRSQSNALLKAGAIGLGYYGAGTVGGEYRSWNITDELAGYLPTFFGRLRASSHSVQISGAASSLDALSTHMRIVSLNASAEEIPIHKSEWMVPSENAGEVETFQCDQHSESPCSEGGTALLLEGQRSGTTRLLMEHEDDILSVRLLSLDPAAIDYCPADERKYAPGQCGCGVPDTDGDEDGRLDCFDGCPSDPAKDEPLICGCGSSEQDSDRDGRVDCEDRCPNDPLKEGEGPCGCGLVEVGTGSLQACIDEYGVPVRLPPPRVRTRRGMVRAEAPRISGALYRFVVTSIGAQGASKRIATRHPSIRFRIKGSGRLTIRYAVLRKIGDRSVRSTSPDTKVDVAS